MKFGLFYDNAKNAALASGINVYDFLKDCKENHSLSYIECGLEDLLADDPDKNELEKLGLSVSVYVRFNPNGVLFFDRTKTVCDYISYLAALGVEHLLLIPMADDGENPKSKDVFERVVATVTQIAEKSASFGITVSYEDYDSFDVPCGSGKEMLIYGEKIPSLKFTFDTGNFQFHSENVRELLPLMRDKIYHIHIKDRATADYNSKTAVTGKGVLPIKQLLCDIKKSGYDGNLTAEMFDVATNTENIIDGLRYVVENF